MAENTENFNDLSANIEPKAIRIINGAIHITASFLCGRFNIAASVFDTALRSVQDEMDQSAVVADGEIWLDDHWFYSLANTPELSRYFSEERQHAVLHLLGHFYERPAGAVVTRGHSCA